MGEMVCLMGTLKVICVFSFLKKSFILSNLSLLIVPVLIISLKTDCPIISFKLGYNFIRFINLSILSIVSTFCIGLYKVAFSFLITGATESFDP